MLYVFLPPQWLRDKDPSVNIPQQRETEDPKPWNDRGYGVYFYPNSASIVNSPKKFLDGADIDTFSYVFVDMDLKDYLSQDPERRHYYETKEAFLTALAGFPLPPTSVVDSGRGVHAYWQVTDLDAMSFLRLQRRIARALYTDPAVSKIKQVMRAPGTLNTKDPDNFLPCEVLSASVVCYTAEKMDSVLPVITAKDEAYCQAHWNKTYQVKEDIKVDVAIPEKFRKLLKSSKEAQKIWAGEVEDRSIADYRLGHIMLAHSFSKEEARSVLVNTGKALQRAPVHRIGYAEGIVDRVWGHEEKPEAYISKRADGAEEESTGLNLSMTVQEILDGAKTSTAGRRIPCWTWIDNTKTGFRLGHVVGLVAGPKVGKTVLSLNMFYGFVVNNPDLDHVFVALEQPQEEIAKQWEKLCGADTHLYRRVHIISNYNADGTHRQLSLTDIKDYLIKLQKSSKRKFGCVVIDHIGALKQDSADGFRAIEQICHDMKSVAIATDTLLVMQSHAPRQKAGRGDLELNQDAAYGTQRFEAYVDWLITMWQPLKRAYSNKKCPKVTAFKFAAVRHKDEGDIIQEDILYRMTFVPATGALREMTEAEETSFDFFNKSCASKRKQDQKKTEILTYTSAKAHANTQSGGDTLAASRAEGLPQG